METTHVTFDEKWDPHEKKESYVKLGQPEQNVERVKPARIEMKVTHARPDELYVSTSAKES